MASGVGIGAVILDSRKVPRSVAFWKKALGYKVAYHSPSFVILRDPQKRDAVALGIQPTRSKKKGVNPVHFDLYADDMEREAARLSRLGAERVRRWAYGTAEANWIVMRDPDGHEFCIVQK